MGLLLRLYFRSIIVLFILVISAFSLVSILVICRDVYFHGMSSSIMSSTPHIRLSLNIKNREIASKISDLLSQIGGISSSSCFIQEPAKLNILDDRSLMAGQVEFSGPVQVIGLDLSQQPSLISLDEFTAWSPPGAARSTFTYKELLWRMIKEDNVTFINSSLKNSIIPATWHLSIPFSFSNVAYPSDKLGGTILGYFTDYSDVQRIFTHLKFAQKLLKTDRIDGYFIRVKNIEDIEVIKEEVSQKLQRSGISGFNIQSWYESEHRQHKTFNVFNKAYLIILVTFNIISACCCILGIYYFFVTKERSLNILRILGISKRSLFLRLSVIYLLVLLIGCITSLFIVYTFHDRLMAVLLMQLNSLITISIPTVQWSGVLIVLGRMIVFYSILFVLFLGYLIKRTNWI